jgi:hypothetical protein
MREFKRRKAEKERIGLLEFDGRFGEKTTVNGEGFIGATKA